MLSVKQLKIKIMTVTASESVNYTGLKGKSSPKKQTGLR